MERAHLAAASHVGRYASANVLELPSCPHTWLFPRCQAVVHHGGAGTTAIGLKTGVPTAIVAFFGDQQLWGTLIEVRAQHHTASI